MPGADLSDQLLAESDVLLEVFLQRRLRLCARSDNQQQHNIGSEEPGNCGPPQSEYDSMVVVVLGAVV